MSDYTKSVILRCADTDDLFWIVSYTREHYDHNGYTRDSMICRSRNEADNLVNELNSEKWISNIKITKWRLQQLND